MYDWLKVADTCVLCREKVLESTFIIGSEAADSVAIPVELSEEEE